MYPRKAHGGFGHGISKSPFVSRVCDIIVFNVLVPRKMSVDRH